MTGALRKPLGSASFLVAGTALVALAVLPLLWGVSTALKSTAQILTYPPVWVPNPPTLQSFEQVWTQSNLPI